MDVFHIDEAGFALTQPTTTSWGAVGCRLLVPYVAPQGRRLNVIGGYFSHGPQAGEFHCATFASLPKPRTGKGTVSSAALARRAEAEGLTEEDLGVIDSAVFLAFVWQAAGRPVAAPDDWQRARPLVVVVDNYSVHKGDRVRAELPLLEAADIYLTYLPAYSPELSEMEPIWKDVKYHRLTRRSYGSLGELKVQVETALAAKALALRQAKGRSTDLLPRAP